MATSTSLSLDDVIARIQPDAAVLAEGRRRMTDIWHGRATDSLPILFSSPLEEPLQSFPDARVRFQDRDAMLYSWAAGLAATARAGSDAQLGIRADTGTGTLATLAGCALLPCEHALPWTTHCTPEQLATFDPTLVDYAEGGIMPRVRELYTYFRERLPACVALFCADTQGPFDLAHLLAGNDFFTLLYDDPDGAHALLEKATALYIAGTLALKGMIGEPLDGGTHFNMALANGGVRVCADTATLLSPAMIEEFVIPYDTRGMAPFGGGFVHYCGDNAALLQALIAHPQVHGLNFGNPERHDFAVIIPALIAAGKCYAGTIPREDEETLDAYFTRVIGYTGDTQRGLIFMPALRPAEMAEPARVLDRWRSLQYVCETG